MVVKDATTLLDVTDDVFLDWWKRKESHGVLEGHLPGIIPLSLLEKILIPADLYNDILTDDERHVISECLPHGGLVLMPTIPLVDATSMTTNEKIVMGTVFQYALIPDTAILPSSFEKGFILRPEQSDCVHPYRVDLGAPFISKHQFIFIRVMGTSSEFSISIGSTTIRLGPRSASILHADQLGESSKGRWASKAQRTNTGAQFISDRVCYVDYKILVSRRAVRVELVGLARLFSSSDYLLNDRFNATKDGSNKELVSLRAYGAPVEFISFVISDNEKEMDPYDGLTRCDIGPLRGSIGEKRKRPVSCRQRKSVLVSDEGDDTTTID